MSLESARHALYSGKGAEKGGDSGLVDEVDIPFTITDHCRYVRQYVNSSIQIQRYRYISISLYLFIVVISVNVEWYIRKSLSSPITSYSSSSIAHNRNTDNHPSTPPLNSALIKILPNFEDVVFGHNTWDDYQNAFPRVFKSMEYPLMKDNIPDGQYLTHFSSSPGLLSSVDDFYIIKNDENHHDHRLAGMSKSRLMMV